MYLKKGLLQFDTYPMLDIVQSIERQIKFFKPNVIFTHNPSEVNIDHKITYDAVEVAARPKKNSSLKKFILLKLFVVEVGSFIENFLQLLM